MLKSTVFIAQVACCTLALTSTGVFAAGVSGQTRLVISAPTKIPGADLFPGNYSIRLVDQLQDRYVFEVSNSSGKTSVSRFLAIPDPKLTRLAVGKPIYWRSSGKDLAIRGIRLKGMAQGAAFVFAKEEAAALAQQVGAPVPAIDPASEKRAALPEMNDSDRQLVTLWLLSTENRDARRHRTCHQGDQVRRVSTNGERSSARQRAPAIAANSGAFRRIPADGLDLPVRRSRLVVLESPAFLTLLIQHFRSGLRGCGVAARISTGMKITP